MTYRLLVLASIVVPATLPMAQGERITVRMAPAPNQTLHLRTTQDMAMTTEGDAAGGRTQPVNAMAMNMHSVVDATSDVGPTDNDGHYAAKMVVDNISTTTTMNGQPMPLPIPAPRAAKQVITFSYDDQGKVIDVSTDGVSASAGASNDAAKQILARAFATVAPMTLAVGESITVPTALNLPLPAGGPGVPMGIAGETRYTLTSVTFDGADRIAHLTSHTTSTTTSGSPAAPAGSPFAFDMTMTSDGKSDVNVDRGIVLHAEQRSTIEGTMRAGTASQAMPNMRMHGTFTIVSDLVK